MQCLVSQKNYRIFYIVYFYFGSIWNEANTFSRDIPTNMLLNSSYGYEMFELISLQQIMK